MAGAAALIKSFNAGEFSQLLGGRVDLDKYPASWRYGRNTIPTPQGPNFRRSGTTMQAPVYNEATVSALVPFIPSLDQGQCIEFAAAKIRFHSESGVLAYTPTAVTATPASAFIKVTSAGHGCVVGDQVGLAGFEFVRNLNGRVGNVTAVAGNDVTTDIAAPVAYGSLAAATIARVYAIASPYAAADVQNIRFVPDEDVLYLFCPGYAPRKLGRYGALDWRLSTIVFTDGPYDTINETTTTVTPATTGNAIVVMTADNLPAPQTASSSGASATHDAFRAFDDDRATYWESNAIQVGTLTLDLGVGTTIDGYVIEMAQANDDVNYKSLDYAPGDFKFQGSPDGIVWTTLNAQIGYSLYDNNRSVYFALKNAVAYRYYQLAITKCTRNGALPPRVARLLMSSRASAAVVWTASAVTGINLDTGVKLTDVGRLFRFKGVEGNWRSMQITAWTSTTVFTGTLQGDVLSTIEGTTQWRFGLFSDTTGWPTCAGFFEDRLWYGGMSGYPNWFAFSVTGKYETLSPTTATGEVTDDLGFAGKLQARRKGQVSWIASDGRAILIGTQAGEWSVTSADTQQAISAKTAKARRASARGSASVEPSSIDKQILYVQRGYRTLREASYDYTVDGYRTPSMSMFATHIGAKLIKQMDFAHEPYSIEWLRLGDGTLGGFTYDREQNVTGWHIHDYGGFIESICVLPSSTTTQDVVWMSIRRVINGVTRRFVERAMPIWDFGFTIDDAHFVDAGVLYNGAAITDVYGLYNYEGATIVGLADGSPITPVVVVGGKITLPVAASRIVLGLPYDSEFETARLDGGAADGTAQGKVKRIHKLKLRLFDSAGGFYTTRGSDNEVKDYIELTELSPATLLDTALPLFSGDTNELDVPDAYSTDGTVLLKQPGELPLPFNVVAIMPQYVTQDG